MLLEIECSTLAKHPDIQKIVDLFESTPEIQTDYIANFNSSTYSPVNLVVNKIVDIARVMVKRYYGGKREVEEVYFMSKKRLYIGAKVAGYALKNCYSFGNLRHPQLTARPELIVISMDLQNTTSFEKLYLNTPLYGYNAPTCMNSSNTLDFIVSNFGNSLSKPNITGYLINETVRIIRVKGELLESEQDTLIEFLDMWAGVVQNGKQDNGKSYSLSYRRNISMNWIEGILDIANDEPLRLSWLAYRVYVRLKISGWIFNY